MGIFDRFKKKQQGRAPQSAGRQAPEADTICLLVMDRVLEDASQAGKLVEQAFGPGALGEIDRSDPRLLHMTVKLEGVEFWCSYMPFPVPPEEMDLSDVPEYSMYNAGEYRAFCENRSFWIMAQKGGGKSLEEKRHICRLFTKLNAVFMAQEGAVGVYVSAAELLISRRVYLHFASILENNMEDPTYFPAPLWIGIRHGKKGDISMIGTWGLSRFGFLELWFMDPKSEWAQVHEKLYLMSVFEITGKELYQNMDTIAFTPGDTSVFKELNGALFIVGGNV